MWTLAWRNVWRRRGRSLFTMTAVGLVVVLSLVYFGIGGAARNALYGSLTDATGHLQVRVEGYRDLRDRSSLLIRDADEVRDVVSSHVTGGLVARVLETPALLEGSGRSRGVALVGVDRSEALRDAYADEALLDGRLPEDGDEEGIALSAGLARAVGVRIGDTVHVRAPGTEGSGAGVYTVVGLLDLPGTAHVAQLSLTAAQDLAAPGALSRIEVHLPSVVHLEDDDALAPLAARLDEALSGAYSVETWRELNPGSAAYLSMMAPMQAVATGIFFILAGLLVTNTVYLGVIERVREFGVIQALGARGREVVGMVLAESLFLCGVGALGGAAVGGAVVARMARGFSFPGELADYMSDLGIPAVMHASIGPTEILVTVGFTLATAVLAAVLPALTATRLEPIEAIRFTA